MDFAQIIWLNIPQFRGTLFIHTYKKQQAFVSPFVIFDDRHRPFTNANRNKIQKKNTTKTIAVKSYLGCCRGSRKIHRTHRRQPDFRRFIRNTLFSIYLFAGAIFFSSPTSIRLFLITSTYFLPLCALGDHFVSYLSARLCILCAP